MLGRALHHVVAGFVRRTWLVAVVTVIVCASFAAHAVAAMVDASYLDPVPPRRAPLATIRVNAPPRTKPDGSAFVARNMFCSTCAPGPGPGPGPTFVPDAVLIATSIGFDPRATVRVPGTDVQGSWGVGEAIPGVGTIAKIGYVSVELVDGSGRHGTISLLESTAGGRGDAGAATPAPAAADDPFADRIKKIDETTFEVDRSLVRELIGGSVKTGGARISPVTKDGQLQGLRLFGVRKDALAGKVGLQNGDVLEAVNNVKIENANTLLTLVSQLETLSAVELAGTRRGKPMTLTLRLR